MKYYYTDPLKAAWMAKEFKLNFQIPHLYKDEDYGMLNVMALQVDASDDETAHYIEAERNNGDSFVFEGCDEEDRYSGKYYIHPDYHDLLKPQAGDLLQNGGGGIIEVMSDGTLFNVLGIYKDTDVEIIQRDGKAFFMPEVEA